MGEDGCVLDADQVLRCWTFHLKQSLYGPGSPGPFTAVTVGPYFTCALGAEQALRCWVSADEGHLCAIRSDDRVLCLGTPAGL